MFALTVKEKERAVMTRILKARQQWFGVMKPLQDTNDCLISAPVLNFFVYSFCSQGSITEQEIKKVDTEL